MVASSGIVVFPTVMALIVIIKLVRLLWLLITTSVVVVHVIASAPAVAVGAP